MGIYKRGAVYWARWTEGGTKLYKSLGTKDRREAERLFEELRGGGRITMGTILSQWCDYQKPRCKPKSLHHYKIVRKRFSAMWGASSPAR